MVLAPVKLSASSVGINGYYSFVGRARQEIGAP